MLGHETPCEHYLGSIKNTRDNSALVAQERTRWLSANYRREKWKRAERRAPLSKVFQLHLSKNKCTSWTFPRRPPGWAIGLAESLASNSCFTSPPLKPEVSHTCQAATWHQDSRLGYTGEQRRCCCYCMMLNIIKTTDGAPVSKSEILSAEVSHAFN